MKAVILFTAAMALAHAQTIDRTKPPETPPLSPFKLPAVKESKLANGLTVLMVEDKRIPLVTLRLVFNGGDRFDPPAQPGLAETVASLLKEGTATRSSRQLAEELADIGASLDAGAGADSMNISGNTLSEHLAKLLAMAADVARNASFPQEEIDLRKGNRVQELAMQRSQSATLANEKLSKLVFGKHPYAQTLPTPAAISSIQRKDLLAYRDKVLVPGNATLVLVGAIPSEAQTLAMIKQSFDSWAAKPVPALPGGDIPAPAKSITLIDRAGSAQADIQIGRHTVNRLHPDYMPLVVATTILGGGASSRLFVNIREKQGYAYDASAHQMAYKDTAIVSVSTQVRDEVLEPALKAVIAELEKMGKEPVTPQELSNMKNYLNGIFVMGLTSQGGVASQLAGMKVNGLPFSFLEQYVTRIRSVEPDQIQRVAAKYFSPSNLTVVVVGDGNKIGPALGKFGKVTGEKAQ
ncbi:MAG: insulinase family protein [Acidobacteria bacterium]|nr:insulinase family protein [Acidobacteriota bacterium]